MTTREFIRIAKSAPPVHSFVIDELALADLLQRGWKRVSKKIFAHLSPAIDFKRGKFSTEGSIPLLLWMDDNAFAEEIASAWEKLSPAVSRYIARAYTRGWLEEGQEPITERKSDANRRLSPETTIPQSGEDSKRVISANLLELVRQLFVNYVKDKVLPAIRNTLAALRKLDSLAVELAQKSDKAGEELDVDFLMQAELARKLRVAAVEKARRQMLEELRTVLETNQGAGLAANLAASRAHHFGFLDWADENGVEYYKVSSVLDVKTCAHCKELNDKVFRVADAKKFRDNYILAANDLNLLKDNSPFVTANGMKHVLGEVDLQEFLKNPDAMSAKGFRTFGASAHKESVEEMMAAVLSSDAAKKGGLWVEETAEYLGYLRNGEAPFVAAGYEEVFLKTGVSVEEMRKLTGNPNWSTDLLYAGAHDSKVKTPVPVPSKKPVQAPTNKPAQAQFKDFTAKDFDVHLTKILDAVANPDGADQDYVSNFEDVILPKYEPFLRLTAAARKLYSYDDITPAQIAAVARYTDADTIINGKYQYEIIQEALRGGKRGLDKSKPWVRTAVRNLDSIFTQESKENIVLWRGNGAETPGLRPHLEKVGGEVQNLIGKTITLDKGYMSTSLDKHTAIRFMMREGGDSIYKINLPKGSKAARYLHEEAGGLETEVEFLLKRETKFKLVKVDGPVIELLVVS